MNFVFLACALFLVLGLAHLSSSFITQQNMASKLNRVQPRNTIIYSKDEDEGMDLNLEEMFEIFDAADKEVNEEDVGMSTKDKPTVGESIMNLFGQNKGN
mmetsp:Transcript_17788/g.23469  ORF Transcript_17788/g.23469 Transcript_17788/m.23469 type:complete len:100 (+) Transcript_17788:87-386(+)